MRNTKTEIRFFTIPEYEKEEKYLRVQHRNGWKFTGITFPCFYHFEKCEAEDVIYQLDYNQDGISHKEVYVKMFHDCGCEYMLDFVGYSYFRKPVCQMKKEEAIFCDDNSKLDMIKRVFRGRMIPLLIIFFACICPQLYLQAAIGKYIGHVIFWLYIGLFLLYIWIFCWFGLQYWNLHQRLEKAK